MSRTNDNADSNPDLDPDPDFSGSTIDKELPGDAERISMRNVLVGLSVAFWGIIIIYAHSQALFDAQAHYGIVFLGGILLLYIFTELMDMAGGGRNYLADDLKRAYGPENRIHATLLTISAIIILITVTYMATNFESLYIDRPGRAYSHEYVMAVAFTLTMLYLTWRAFGVTFLAVVVIGLGYGYFGWLMPGVLSHAGLPAERILRIIVISVSGFFGFLNQLTATWIALFLLYAGLLKTYGAFDLILRFALKSMYYVGSGIAQVAVVSSTIIGSINGSQTANAGMTGSFTIPLMKNNGMRSETAAGIESTASTAGQVLPPVMGAGAFIMASLIQGVSYVDVLIAGILPAAILVISIVIAVHYVAAPQLVDVDPDSIGQDQELISRGEFAAQAVKFGLPFLLLIYFLGIIQTTVMTAALYTAVSMIITGTVIPLIQSTVGLTNESMKQSVLRTLWETVDGGRQGVIVLAPVAIILSAINGVVDILTTTGVPGGITLALIDLSGGELAIAAVLAMIICIILGLGMPVTASYTVVALLVAPTFINQFFLPDLAAHYFVFYAAILSSITPPIATACAVACGIAKSDFWKTCYEAIKISAPLFVLPFTFVFHPEIVSAQLDLVTMITALFALFGSIAIIHGINYPFTFSKPITLSARFAFFLGGVFAMVYPARTIQAAALSVLAIMYLLQIVFGGPSPLKMLHNAIRTVRGSRSDIDDTGQSR